MIWNLENSNSIYGRQEYTKQLLWFISQAKARIKKMEDATEEIDLYAKELESQFLIKLKQRLLSYDVYNQKSMVRCFTCRELDCVCDALAPPQPPDEDPKVLIPNLPF